MKVNVYQLNDGEIRFAHPMSKYDETLRKHAEATSSYPSVFLGTLDFAIETPKKKVVKEVEMYMNMYPNPSYNCVYKSKTLADEKGAIDRIACVKLTGTYETEA